MMEQKINYQNKLKDLVKTFKDKKRLLLHSCCGPCSTEVINFLKDYFEITVFYYNPNIEPEEEYIHRKSEQIRFINELKLKEPNIKLDYLDSSYENLEFKEIAKGLEKEREGGARCSKCFYLRIKKTALCAREHNYEFFGTTLTVSPHKNSQIINKIGETVAKEVGVPFIYGDFKKNEGYKRSIEYSKLYNLYRQDYCGCLYGKEFNNEH